MKTDRFKVSAISATSLCCPHLLNLTSRLAQPAPHLILIDLRAFTPYLHSQNEYASVHLLLMLNFLYRGRVSSWKRIRRRK